ncbi:hypothetical protein D3C80_1783520 [compost metagenome]
MFSKRAKRDDFAVLTAHFLNDFRHQLFADPLSFQTRIDIRVLDNTEIVARGDIDYLSHLIALRIVNVKFVMAFQNIHGSSLIFGDISGHRSGRYRSLLSPFRHPLYRE